MLCGFTKGPVAFKMAVAIHHWVPWMPIIRKCSFPLCPYGILLETRRSLLDYIPDTIEMGCVFQENSDKVVKTPPNSSFL
jgi:hypothetical protein